MGMLKIVNTIKQILGQTKDLKYITCKFNEYNKRYFNGELPEIKMVVNMNQVKFGVSSTILLSLKKK